MGRGSQTATVPFPGLRTAESPYVLTSMAFQETLAWLETPVISPQERFQEAEERVEQMSGVLGPTAVEESVKTAITALQALGYPTFASCGGHPEKTIQDTPYIAIGLKHMTGPEPKWLRDKNKIYRQEINLLLQAFYQGRPRERFLEEGRKLKTGGGFGSSFTIIPSKYRYLATHPFPDIPALIAAQQQEMRLLGDYLKQEFLSKRLSRPLTN